MRIHRIFHADLSAQVLLPVLERDGERLVTLNQQPPFEDPPERVAVSIVKDYGDGVALTETDFPWLQGNIPVYTPRAYAELSPFLREYGRPFTLVAEDGSNFVGFRVDRVVDALDEHASEISRFADGRVMTIDRHVFRPDAIGNAAMFRLPQFDRGGWTYVTDDYVEAIISTGLAGAEFDLAWSDEPAHP